LNYTRTSLDAAGWGSLAVLAQISYRNG
jgi:hypothetical protein